MLTFSSSVCLQALGDVAGAHDKPCQVVHCANALECASNAPVRVAVFWVSIVRRPERLGVVTATVSTVLVVSGSERLWRSLSGTSLGQTRAVGSCVHGESMRTA